MLSTPYQNGMKWFEGVVESRKDPLKLGRVQVRVFALHTENLSQIPSKDLHWMQVMHPTTSAATSGVSKTPKLVEGSHVVGYFRDGDACQDGLVIGSVAGIPQKQRDISRGFNDPRTQLSPNSVPGKPTNISYQNGTGVVVSESTRLPFPKYIDEPDLSRLTSSDRGVADTVLDAKEKSRATQTNIAIAGGGSFSEPEVLKTAQYPYNDVSESESGHVIEIDDTPQKERVHIAHRTGSFDEMRPNGDVVKKSAKNLYNIIHASSYTHVEGDYVVTVDKNAKLLVNAEGSSSSFIIQVGSNGNLTINVASGDFNIDVNGNMNINCSGDYIVSANTINLN